MTDEEIAGVGPALAAYLGRFRACFPHPATAAHFATYCRGLLSDLDRKSVEPIALASGTAVRTLQEFLASYPWDHDAARNILQKHLAGFAGSLPGDATGTVGVIDETSCRKWGDQTPGVQRQYLGCVGKVDNGIVTVHVGLARGDFHALLDAELFLPKSWSDDRERCDKAGIPGDMVHRPKWRIALEQVVRLRQNGVRFDWLTFDEGYGASVPLLSCLNLIGQRFVAEIPVNFSVRNRMDGPPMRADARLSAADAARGATHRLEHKTTADSRWRATTARVWAGGREHLLVAAVNEATAEVKYFLSGETGVSLKRLLAVAFRRWTVEHCFRAAKQETGLMNYEGRQYDGLIRHLILALTTLGFAALHAEGLRGGKPDGDNGTGVPGDERNLPDPVPPTPGKHGPGQHGTDHSLPSATKQNRRRLPQKAKA